MSENYRGHVIRVEPGDYSGFVGIVVCVRDDVMYVVAEIAEQATEAKALRAARKRVDLLVEKPK